MPDVVPLWVSENVFPAIVKAAVRDAPELAATEHVIVPFPVPVAPEVTVAQETPVEALQEQPLGAVTARVVVVAVLPTEALAGEIL